MTKRNLVGKTIVITGAGSGIGKATALASAAAGMDVVVAGRKLEPLENVAVAISQMGRRALPVVCDVRRDEDVARLIEQTEKQLGALDVMFANAGYGLFASVEHTTDQQYRDIFETNFFGTIRCIRAALPVMRRSGSLRHVVICSSSVSEIGLPMYGAYCATKAAQDSIASALRAELAHENFAVSSVHPIGTRSEFFTRTGELHGAPVPVGTAESMMQSPEHVAKKIVACMRKPCAEVWPHMPTRLGLAIVTAFPMFNAMSMKKMMQDMRTSGAVS